MSGDQRADQQGTRVHFNKFTYRFYGLCFKIYVICCGVIFYLNMIIFYGSSFAKSNRCHFHKPECGCKMIMFKSILRRQSGLVFSLVSLTLLVLWSVRSCEVYGAVTDENTEYSLLHSFNVYDGLNPIGALTLAGSTIYGTTYNLDGIFRINIDGTGFKVLHTFNNSSVSNYSEGRDPHGSLTLVGSTLFGTATKGGTFGDGTIFRVNIDGTGFKVLHHFSISDGRYPLGALTLVGSTLYGTTSQGGSASLYGTIYRINMDGTGFQVLHNFTGNGGWYPRGSLTLVGSTLYGATSDLNFAQGTIFRINTDGTGFNILHNFTGGDGSSPNGSLVLVDSTLYGTTSMFGGTIFRMNTDGTGFNVLHTFSGGDGRIPNSPLAIVGSRLYGTTSLGGSHSYGTVFGINMDGTGFNTLHNFTGGDGSVLNGSLTFAGSTLYGTTAEGGSYGYGTVFAIKGIIVNPIHQSPSLPFILPLLLK